MGLTRRIARGVNSIASGYVLGRQSGGTGPVELLTPQEAARSAALPPRYIGTVTSITAGSGLTGGTITSSGTIALDSPVTVAHGGSGQTSYVNGQLLIGNTTGNTLAKATLTQGTGISITNGTGSITIANSGVTSVALSLPAELTVSGSPVTTTGTLTAVWATESANRVFAGPTTGSAATPAFRLLVGADLPNPSSSSLGGVQSYASVSHQWINTISTSGVPSSTQPAFTDISGTLTVGSGGTGITSGTSGGIPYFSSTSTIASSALLSTNNLVLGAGASTAPFTDSKWSIDQSAHLMTLNNSAVATLVSPVINGLQIQGADSTVPGVHIEAFAAAPSIIGRRADTSGASPSAVQLNDLLLNIAARGYGATGYSGGGRVVVGLTANEAWSDTAQGTRIDLRTTPSGSTTVATVATINNASGLVLSTPMLVASGGTGIGSGTSGGVPYFSSTSTIASSALLGANNLVIGGGAGAALATNGDWSISSNILTGNLNAAAVPSALTGAILQLQGADATTTLIQHDIIASAGSIIGRRANNTSASPTAAASGNNIYTFSGRGYGTTGFQNVSAGAFQVRANENFSDTANGGLVAIRTCANGTLTVSDVATFTSQGCEIFGVNTNSSAATGFRGEYLESVVLIASAVGLTTGVTADVTNLTITAGQWEVGAEVWLTIGAGTTLTTMRVSIGTTSATLVSVPASDMAATITTGGGLSFAAHVIAGPCNPHLSTSTVYYLPVRIDFAVSTCSVYGKLWARRVR